MYRKVSDLTQTNLYIVADALDSINDYINALGDKDINNKYIVSIEIHPKYFKYPELEKVDNPQMNRHMAINMLYDLGVCDRFIGLSNVSENPLMLGIHKKRFNSVYLQVKKFMGKNLFETIKDNIEVNVWITEDEIKTHCLGNEFLYFKGYNFTLMHTLIDNYPSRVKSENITDNEGTSRRYEWVKDKINKEWKKKLPNLPSFIEYSAENFWISSKYTLRITNSPWPQ